MGDWQRTDEAVTVEDAFRAVDSGADWALLWCGRKPTRSSDKKAVPEALGYARRKMIDPTERVRLLKKGQRKAKYRRSSWPSVGRTSAASR
ncbi:MAG: hypothetical protein QM650_01030 [Microlunatus sp.]